MFVLGSSPLTRGTLTEREARYCSLGIIPAYAGNTNHDDQDHHRDRDHPRLRGEHDRLEPSYETVAGSSPLTRGTQFRGDAAHFNERIIPAYAGNTCSANYRTKGIWDHPRLRGEHIIATRTTHTITGSSPLTRGTHYQRLMCQQMNKFCTCFTSEVVIFH